MSKEVKVLTERDYKKKWQPIYTFTPADMRFLLVGAGIKKENIEMATSVLDALVLGQALPDDDINNIRELHIYDMGVSKDNVGVSIHLEGDEE